MPVWKKVCVYFAVMYNILPYTFFAQIYKFDISEWDGDTQGQVNSTGFLSNI